MNKRDLFWFKRLLGFGSIILLFTILSLYNILLFNGSYMQEEYTELNIFQKQIIWAIKPYLAQKDYKTIRNYCDDFKNEDMKFRIFDQNKKLLASSKGYTDEELIPEGSRILKQQNNLLKVFRNAMKTKMIGMVEEIQINNNTYYLEVTISEEEVLKSIIHAQTSIWIFFALCIICFIFAFVYVLRNLRIPFDTLQDSVIEIANGNLDKEIKIPNLAILQELAIAVRTMTTRLKKQIIRLKQLEEYKSDFIRDVSHEIKTPITAINTAVELIENGKELTSERDKECFKIISFQVKYINTLVNDILSLAEIESEKTLEQKNFKNFNLNETIKNTLNYIPTENIQINIHEKGNSNSPISFCGEEKLISRAILNILTNGIKYSHSDRIDIYIEKDDKVKIKIQDYGVGIEPEHLERIFEKFYRVDKARSRKSGGSGLGLAIVKNIVELHNGNVYAKSEPNKGTCFVIELPC